MKKYFTLLSMLLLLGLSSNLVGQTTAEKIGFTNVELILAYIPEIKAIDKQMATMEGKLKESLEVKQKYYQQKMMGYVEKEQNGGLTDAEKEAAGKEMQKLEAEIQADLQKAQERLMAKRMEMLKPIQDKLQKAIDEVAKEGNYTYILNQAVGSGIPSILYGDKKYDVTEAIARKMGIDVEGGTQ